MESIDKLREYVTGGAGQGISIICEKNILKNLDNIEREVEGMRDFCERLDDAATKREDVTLWGVDYTAMPVDAEGVPIHVGDVMEWPDCSAAEVVGIGNDTFFYVEDGEDAAEWSCANDKIHHHAPTVEDVLREFADEVWNRCCEGATASDSGIDELVAECAARLRMAGDGE